MEIQLKHISHKLIDSLSDGVFSIALTLLGLDVVALVSEIGHKEDFNSALFEQWPTFLGYVLGFVVLFSMWYTYHAFGQYTDGTNTWIVWNHGLNMLWVALMPFGVALLADTLNSENRKWGVFYFGICLFGYNFTWLTQWALAGFKFPVKFKEDFPWDHDLARKTLPLFFGASSLIGIILIATSLVNPWIALAGYGLYVLLNVSPVTSMTKLMLRLSTLVNKQA